MSRRTVKLTCTGTDGMGEAIELLLWRGLHGNTRAEVVRNLVTRSILELIREGHIKIADIEEPKVRPKI